MAGTLPPLFEITDDDHGGYAAVTLYTLLALALVVVGARLSTRWVIGRVIHPDDILLAAATVSIDPTHPKIVIGFLVPDSIY